MKTHTMENSKLIFMLINDIINITIFYKKEEEQT